jgi:hypothetical protein
MKKNLGKKYFSCFIILLVGCGTMKTTTEKDVIEKADISTVSGYTDSIKKTVQGSKC